jgi:Plant transposon protein
MSATEELGAYATMAITNGLAHRLLVRDLLLTEKRLSQWIESFRKDVECVFGILKGRFRILKTGIRLEGVSAEDDIWLTCCALHNMLLEIDGLDKQWEEGVPSDWESTLGDNDPTEMARYAPFAIQRLQNPEQFGSRQHEQASAAPRPLVGDQPPNLDGDGDESIGSEGTGERTDAEGYIYVNSLSYSEFRDKLVQHFDILWQRHRIVWPRSDTNRRVI